ncbi:F-box/kelch-repeat protein At1g80440-like [Silene latifolia]|uniref:F-box/kelch-repeat protein At1g80440-like n=1 Tax=Silene latifolia TaxID=37657 RepID=UPI003D776129
MGHIIPGLIDDLGRECLIRTPYQDLPTASLVCKMWRDEITGPQFRRFRKAAGVTRPVIILAQAKTEDPKLTSGQGELKQSCLTTPTYQLILSDPTTRSWTRLPAIPGLPDGVGLPVFCGLVGSVTDILVIGGWDPVTLRASSDVYIYSFLTGRWRKGADMPGVRRSFFGCATSDDDRMVIVAGGHDEDKNALKSAMMYDVDKDEWTLLPDMARERDECKAIFHCGKFHVISGYSTDTQGCFERTAEVFDTSTWQWGPIIEDFAVVSANPNPSSYVASQDGNVYACVDEHSGDIAVRVGDSWKVIGTVPAEVRRSRWMVEYEENRVLVIGSSKEGKAHEGYVLDLKKNKWSKVDLPNQFSGHVQCGCVIEL